MAMLAALLTAVLIGIYYPALHGPPIWDDHDLIFDSALMRSPWGLWRIWTARVVPDLWPITYSYFWLAYQLFGDFTFPYHMINLCLHASNGMLAYALLQRLRVPYAFFTTLAFTCHPMQVETVAWIFQFKTLAASSCGLAALLVFERYLQAGRRRLLLSSAGLLAVGMLCKSQVVFVPAVALGIAWHRYGRLGPAVASSWPLAAVGGVLALLSIAWYPRGSELPLSEQFVDLAWDGKLARAGVLLWFYLAKLLWPLPLSFVYGPWQLPREPLWASLPAAGWCLLLLVFYRFRSGLGSASYLGLGYFALALAPALGFFSIYYLRYSWAADHWQYLASIGIWPMLAWLLARLFAKLPSQFLLGIQLLIVAGLAVLSHQRSKLFADEEALWRQALGQNQDSPLVYHELGQRLKAKGHIPEARAAFAKALALKPDYKVALNNMGSLALSLGEREEAIAYFRRAIHAAPEFAIAHANLGLALSQQGQPEEAEAALRHASKLAPELAAPHRHLAYLLSEQQRPDEAIAAFRRLLQLEPTAKHFNDLGQMLRLVNRHDEAKLVLEQALALDPKNAYALANLGLIYLARPQREDQAQGINLLQQAVALAPQLEVVHLALIEGLFLYGDLEQARLMAKRAKDILPDARKIELWLQQHP